MTNEHTLCIPHTQFFNEATAPGGVRSVEQQAFWQAICILHRHLRKLGIELMAVHMKANDYAGSVQRFQAAIMVAIRTETLRRISVDVPYGPDLLSDLADQIAEQCGLPSSFRSLLEDDPERE